jgi:hypothetical protein
MRSNIIQAEASLEEIEALTEETIDDWLGNALDIEVHSHTINNSEAIIKVAILVTYGGPTTRIWCDENHQMIIEVADWNNIVTLPVSNDLLRERLMDIAFANTP